MENYEKRTKLESELIGYKITLRRGNPDRETARELYRRIYCLERKIV